MTPTTPLASPPLELRLSALAHQVDSARAALIGITKDMPAGTCRDALLETSSQLRVVSMDVLRQAEEIHNNWRHEGRR